jgi:hypothetical protein
MRRILFAPIVLMAVLPLAGCLGLGGGGNAPQNYAEDFCEQQIAPKFDNPDSVVWGQYEGGVSGSGSDFDFTIPATADVASGVSTTFSVSCAVNGTENNFTLVSFDIIETGPAK